MKSSRQRSLAAVLLVAAAATPLQTLNAAAILQKAEASGVEDDLIIIGRSVPLLSNRADGADSQDAVKFQLDACGTLERPQANRRLAGNGFDEMDDTYEDDPLDEAKMLISRWLAAHAEVAVIADGVERSCDSDSIDLDDPVLDLAAADRMHIQIRWLQLHRTSYIA